MGRRRTGRRDRSGGRPTAARAGPDLTNGVSHLDDLGSPRPRETACDAAIAATCGRPSLVDPRRIVAARLGVRPQQLTWAHSGQDALRRTLVALVAKHRRRTGRPGRVLAIDGDADTGDVISLVGAEHLGIRSESGRLGARDAADHLTMDVAAVVCPWVRPSTGEILDVAQITSSVTARSLPLVIDASAAVGRMELRLPAEADAVTFDGARRSGVSGAGAVVRRRSIRLPGIDLDQPDDGDPGVQALAAAIAAGNGDLRRAAAQVDRLVAALRGLDRVRVIGSDRLASIASIAIDDVDIADLLVDLSDDGLLLGMASDGDVELLRVALTPAVDPSSIDLLIAALPRRIVEQRAGRRASLPSIG